ncbi:Crossover junction endodeoxyribonuclease RuvC [hydrothermal vent metagenome]|uniref:Crossover junction endodeoxyribonuclease RuvC n=1 Tax=hydrothermal vent metagenome TaxID=652676 RepID=A0A3B0TT00_9ZZZZ
MIVLGVDPGIKATGYGFLDFSKQKVLIQETGTIEPNPKDLFENRINKIHKILDALVVQYHPDVMVLEKLFAHQKHPMTSSILGHVRGVICLLCAQRGVRLVEHSPKRIRKALTGNGNATKLQIKQMVAHSLGVNEQKLTLDASDALALALGYIQLNERKI